MLKFKIDYQDLFGNKGSFVIGGETAEEVADIINRTLSQNNWFYLGKNDLNNELQLSHDEK